MKNTTFALEERAGRAVLDAVYELTNRFHLDLESHREQALDARGQRLENMADQLDDSNVPVTQRMMLIAHSDGEGDYRYNWRRLKNEMRNGATRNSQFLDRTLSLVIAAAGHWIVTG